MRLLLVEDDEDFGQSLRAALQDEGYSVDWTRTGLEGQHKASEWEYDLVILDRMLPEMDGTSILRGLRKKSSVPVLMLTALNTAEHRAQGLDLGADDYLGKPFELQELFARLRALLRRSYGIGTDGIQCGQVRLVPATRQVFLEGREVVLSAAEVRIIEILLLRQGRTVSHMALNDRLGDFAAELTPNALEVCIHRIRKKLGKDFIQTRRGLGYVIP